MNPAVLTRLDQLEQEWQEHLLMQPSSGQADKKKGGYHPASAISLARPGGREQMIRPQLQR